MKITAGDRKLGRALENETDRIRQFGPDQARKLKYRLTELEEAESLADFWPPNKLPQRCHELVGDLAGTFSIDLKQPFRLLFEPVGLLPDTSYADQRERWAAIKEIRIITIEDTHG